MRCVRWQGRYRLSILYVSIFLSFDYFSKSCVIARPSFTYAASVVSFSLRAYYYLEAFAGAIYYGAWTLSTLLFSTFAKLFIFATDDYRGWLPLWLIWCHCFIVACLFAATICRIILVLFLQLQLAEVLFQIILPTHAHTPPPIYRLILVVIRHVLAMYRWFSRLRVTASFRLLLNTAEVSIGICENYFNWWLSQGISLEASCFCRYHGDYYCIRQEYFWDRLGRYTNTYIALPPERQGAYYERAFFGPPPMGTW